MATNYRTMQEIVYSAIRDGILNGQHPPGKRLLTDELARDLGVSRMPVREALHRLQAAGLVTIAPHRGIVVNSFSEREIAEIFHMRAVLEGLATRLAVPNLTDAELDAMDDLLEEMALAVTACDVPQMLGLNRKFHTLIWRAAAAPRLEGLIQNLYDTSERFRNVSLLIPSRMQEILGEHRRIAGALRARDADAAERLANEHHEVTAQRLRASFERKSG